MFWVGAGVVVGAADEGADVVGGLVAAVVVAAVLLDEPPQAAAPRSKAIPIPAVPTVMVLMRPLLPPHSTSLLLTIFTTISTRTVCVGMSRRER
jgi:hypothetical protein